MSTLLIAVVLGCLCVSQLNEFTRTLLIMLVDPSFIVIMRARFFNKIGLLLKETTVPHGGSLTL